LAHPGELLGLAAGFLLASDWLGIWIVFALACVLTAARQSSRTGSAAVLCGLVGALLAGYLSISFVTALPAAAHPQGSFFRLLCQLTPLALLALASALPERAAPVPLRPRPQAIERDGGQA